MEGEVTDVADNLLPDFNGTVYPVVFDKPQTINTLANDPTSQVMAFQAQNNVLIQRQGVGFRWKIFIQF